MLLSIGQYLAVHLSVRGSQIIVPRRLLAPTIGHAGTLKYLYFQVLAFTSFVTSARRPSIHRPQCLDLDYLMDGFLSWTLPLAAPTMCEPSVFRVSLGPVQLEAEMIHGPGIVTLPPPILSPCGNIRPTTIALRLPHLSSREAVPRDLWDYSRAVHTPPLPRTPIPGSINHSKYNSSNSNRLTTWVLDRC